MNDLLELADLPGVTAPNGGCQFYFADVHTQQSGRTKRRNEVLVAIDRQGINVYDVSIQRSVRTPHLVLTGIDTSAPACHILRNLAPHHFHLFPLFTLLKAE